MSPTQRQRLLDLAQERGFLGSGEVRALGIHGQVLTRLVEEGLLERVARGRYRLTAIEPSEHHGLALASAVVPRGVICLLSALSFHGIGTQLPRHVWIAIDRRARKPRLEYPPLRVLRFSGPALSEGVEEHDIEGSTVRVTCVAKTLADCFKYRNKIGLDVALEALRDAWVDRRSTIEEILHYARVCRVERVMRPYLEAFAA